MIKQIRNASGLFLSSIFFLLMLQACGEERPSLPFHKGVNLSKWLEGASARTTPYHRYGHEDFKHIKSLGMDVIRLPLNLHGMASSKPDYLIDPLYLEFIDSAISWAEQENLHLILDNHSFSFTKNTDAAIEEVLCKVWAQLSLRYAKAYDKLYFEILNEPHGIDDELWGRIQQNAITEIRKNDSKHYIILTGAEWSNAENLSKLPNYSEDKLIYTFHLYHPFLFTHQGTNFTTPKLEQLKALPFPYDKGQMPEMPGNFKGTWAENNYSYRYWMEGTAKSVESYVKSAADFSADRSVPIFCGEFGTYRKSALPEHRYNWYQTVTGLFAEYDIPWTMWDYRGGFGLFRPHTQELFPEDADNMLIKKMGLKIPQNNISQPRYQSPLNIYSDYLNRYIINASIMDESKLDLFHTDSPHSGRYCMRIQNLKQYQPVIFTFSPMLKSDSINNGALSLYFRSSDIGFSFYIIIKDDYHSQSNEYIYLSSPLDRQPGSNWQQIIIPLSQFQLSGKWVDGKWQAPIKKIPISSIAEMRIVNTKESLENIRFYLDEVHLTWQ